MLLAIAAVIVGLVLLVWSADKFVEGAAAVAGYLGMPPLLIGMVVVGFGTSAPEMVVSVLAALEGSPGIALGNAYGSNITNIALILGLTALISPIAVQKNVVRKEMPILLVVTAFAAWQLLDGALTFGDGLVLLLLLLAYMSWTVYSGLQNKSALSDVVPELSKKSAWFWLSLGLLILVLSSRILVWGAVKIAQDMGVSDLIIGLTVVAVGTSLPELASSIAAARKGEHDIALGNVVGSNLFNTLAVVGLAACLHPMSVAPEILWRDAATMSGLTLLLLLFCLSWRKGQSGSISRSKGAVLLSIYMAYTAYLIATAF